MVHRHAHRREHTLRGTHQSQELQVLVPVKEGVRTVFGPHSIRQRPRLVGAPLLLPLTRTQSHMRDGDITHCPCH
eukprot:2583276-Rhodomonas_salina.1